MRLPRLERLSTALGLCGFEKNVVVSMIGQAIAPRSIGLMGGGRMDGPGASPYKTMQVEVLLRSFSHSLQQQIEQRKHFYKSAVLVREGILVLHGDELGADLTQTLAEIDRRMLDFVVGLDTESSNPPGSCLAPSSKLLSTFSSLWDAHRWASTRSSPNSWTARTCTRRPWT